MRRIVLLLMLVSPLLGRSQAELKIENIYGVSAPALNPSISQVKLFGTVVRNYSAFFAFNDTLRVYIAVLDTLDQPQVMDEVNKGYKTINMAGSGMDSTVIDTITVDITPSFFHEGNNTVVIWPASPGTYTLDTFEVIVTFTGINELIANDINIRMGPNPANDHLYLSDPDNVVKQVRIRSMEGKLIGTAKTNSILSLQGFSDGMYLVELETGQRVYSRKLIIRK